MFLGYLEFVKINVYLFCDWTQKPMKREMKKSDGLSRLRQQVCLSTYFH